MGDIVPIPRGEVPERPNGHAWKACVLERAPRVRIPRSPPFAPFLFLVFLSGLRAASRSSPHFCSWCSYRGYGRHADLRPISVLVFLSGGTRPSAIHKPQSSIHDLQSGLARAGGGIGR